MNGEPIRVIVASIFDEATGETVWRSADSETGETFTLRWDARGFSLEADTKATP